MEDKSFFCLFVCVFLLLCSLVFTIQRQELLKQNQQVLINLQSLSHGIVLKFLTNNSPWLSHTVEGSLIGNSLRQ